MRLRCNSNFAIGEYNGATINSRGHQSLIPSVLLRHFARTLCVFAVLFSTQVSAAHWSGYINTETFVDQQYGYMSIRDEQTSYSAVRLVCFPPVGFRIYIDNRLFPDAKGSKITFAVDSLPVHEIATNRTSTEFIVTEAYDDFWDLVAQMVAGAKVVVQASEGQQSAFALTGFKDAYSSACAWMSGSDGYLSHLDDYQ